MAKRKLIWSQLAKTKLFEILDYFDNRNNSKDYSKKLYKRVSREVSVLAKHPEMGIKTDFEYVRCLIVDHYMFFYEITDVFIIIHTVWDSRQNPINLKIK